jgi:hypothetical protein
MLSALRQPISVKHRSIKFDEKRFGGFRVVSCNAKLPGAAMEF